MVEVVLRRLRVPPPGSLFEETAMTPFVTNVLLGFAFCFAWALGMAIAARLMSRHPGRDDAFLFPTMVSLALTTICGAGIVSFFVALVHSTPLVGFSTLAAAIIVTAVVFRLCWMFFGPGKASGPMPSAPAV